MGSISEPAGGRQSHRSETRPYGRHRRVLQLHVQPDAPDGCYCTGSASHSRQTRRYGLRAEDVCHRMGCVSSSQIAFFVPEREGVYRLQWINSTGAAAHIGTHALAAPSEPDLAKSAVKVQIVPGAGFYHGGIVYRRGEKFSLSAGVVTCSGSQPCLFIILSHRIIKLSIPSRCRELSLKVIKIHVSFLDIVRTHV